MGAEQSQSASEGVATFAQEERDKIEALFRGLALNEADKFWEKKLQGHLRHYFRQEFVTKLFHEMSAIDAGQPRRSSSSSQAGSGQLVSYVTKSQFYHSLAILLKGSVEQQAQLIGALSSPRYESTPSAKELCEFVEDYVRAYFIAIEELPEVKSWQLGSITDAEISSLAAYIMSDLASKDEIAVISTPPRRYDDQALSRWLSQCTFFHHMMSYVNQVAFDVLLMGTKPTVPHCRDKSWHHGGTLLDLPMLILLNQAVPLQHRAEWRHVYDSRQHGESFTTLVRQIKGRGPTVIIVEDDDGHVFGGFAAESWQMNPRFVGSHQCFLFTLRPQYGIYRPTGLNENYMYLDVGQETLPNGIGMGGQFNYFGLWLDAEYGRGESRARPTCTTYRSPQLSCKAEFAFTRMEVWAVGPEPGQESATIDEDGSLETARQTSVLDSDPGAKALLNLIGRASHSEGLRESDRVAGVPEEHHLYRSPSNDL